MMKKVLIGLVLVLGAMATAIGIGCASMSKYITPATIDRHAVKFVVESGVADANEFKGWANLEKAVKLESYVNMAYEVREQAIRQMKEDLQLNYNHLTSVVSRNREEAQAREEALFADGGALSTILAASGLGAFTGLIGLMRKRPGDLTKEDVEKATAGLRQEVGIKDAQFQQVVIGLEKFMKNKDDIGTAVNGDSPAARVDAVLALMKTYLKKEQDSSTQQEVGKVRATV